MKGETVNIEYNFERARTFLDAALFTETLLENEIQRKLPAYAPV